MKKITKVEELRNVPMGDIVEADLMVVNGKGKDVRFKSNIVVMSSIGCIDPCAACVFRDVVCFSALCLGGRRCDGQDVVYLKSLKN